MLAALLLMAAASVTRPTAKALNYAMVIKMALAVLLLRDAARVTGCPRISVRYALTIATELTSTTMPPMASSRPGRPDEAARREDKLSEMALQP